MVMIFGPLLLSCDRKQSSEVQEQGLKALHVRAKDKGFLEKHQNVHSLDISTHTHTFQGLLAFHRCSVSFHAILSFSGVCTKTTSCSGLHHDGSLYVHI